MIVKTLKPNRILIIAGPSGVGKTTLANHVLKRVDNLQLSISITTRPMRPKEIDGEEYRFISVKQFKQMIKENAFFEYEEVYGDYYGTPKNNLLADKITLLILDPFTAHRLRQENEDIVAVFILPPSIKELKDRLLKRKTSEEVFLKRTSHIDKELNLLSGFDYGVINTHVHTAVKQLMQIVVVEDLMTRNFTIKMT